MKVKKETNGSFTVEVSDATEVKIKTIEIRGAKLKDDFCNYTYELKTGPTAGDACNRSGASIVHDDLKTAFRKLSPHLAVICEEVDSHKISDISDYELLDPTEDWRANSIEKKVLQFFVTGFTLDGTGENEGVTLFGFKRLSTGDDLTLKTYKIKWSGVYDFIDDLRSVVDGIIHEVEEYMNGKAAPKMVQQDLFEEETDKVKEETSVSTNS
jgi:hypothetical protein